MSGIAHEVYIWDFFSVKVDLLKFCSENVQWKHHKVPKGFVSTVMRFLFSVRLCLFAEAGWFLR